MRLVLCCSLLVLVACFGWQATAQATPGTLVIGQVFTGQYDDFTTFGDNIVVKVATSDGTVLRFNGIGLHFYYPWYNYKALRSSLEAPITYNISGDGQLKYACTNADIVGDITGYIVVVKRVRGASGTCRTADQYQVLQTAGARGIVVVDDVQERLSFRWYESSPPASYRPWTPSAMISAADGAVLMSSLAGNAANAVLSDGRENSLRINVTNVVDCDSARRRFPNCGAGSLFVEANVEFRLTANASTPLPQWLSYGKYFTYGFMDKSSGNITLNPVDWIVRPRSSGVTTAASLFTITGVVLSQIASLGGTDSFTLMRGSSLGEYTSTWQVRDRTGFCQPALSFADQCEPAPPTCAGAQQCAVALDNLGYRFFNDEQACPWGSSMMFFSEETYNIEGSHVTMAPWAYSGTSQSSCPAGSQHADPYYTNWPIIPSDFIVNSSCVGSSCIGGTYPTWVPDSSGGFVMSSPWNCPSRAVCTQSMTRTVSIPQVSGNQPNSYVEFSYRGISSQSHYYWYDSNQLYLFVNFDGNVNQVFPQRNQFIYSQETVEDWTIFRYIFPPCTKPVSGNCVYDITWSFIFKNYYYYSNAAGAAIDSILIVGTQGSAPTCNPCPPGSCSPSGSLGCTLCPLGSFSSSKGASSCSACPNPLPDRARYTLIGDTAATCQLSCGPGYQVSQNRCVPIFDLCYLPSRDRVMDSNHYYPTSIAMLAQCLQQGYQVPPAVMQKTIDSVIEMVSQYSNLTLTFLNALQAIQANVLSGYGNLYALESAIMALFAAQNDAELIYQPSLFLQHLALYLPFNFDMFVNPTTNQRSIYITDMNPAAALYGYTDMSTVDYSQYVGWEVVSITDSALSPASAPALEVIKKFAASASVGVTTDAGASLNLALHTGRANVHDLNGQLPLDIGQVLGGQMSCGYGFRPLFMCNFDIVTPPVITMVLQPSSRGGQPPGQAVTITPSWSLLYDAVGYDLNCSFSGKTFGYLKCADAVSSLLTNGASPSKDGVPDQAPYDCVPHDSAFGTTFSSIFSPVSRTFHYPPAASPDLHLLSFVGYNLTGDWRDGISGLTCDGSPIQVYDNFNAATGFLVQRKNGPQVGILELRSFENDELALHTLLTAMGARQGQADPTGLDGLIVDVRGHPGGSNCHAYQAAQLLSAHLNSNSCSRECSNPDPVQQSQCFQSCNPLLTPTGLTAMQLTLSPLLNFTMTIETILSRGQPTGFFVDPVTGADQKDINWFVYGNSGPCYSTDAVDPMGNKVTSCAYSQKVEQKCPNPEDAWNDGSLSRIEQKQYNSIADFTFDSCPPIDPFDLAFQRDRPFGPRSPARPAGDVPAADSKLPKEVRLSAPPQWSGSDGARQQYRIKTYCQGQITAQIAGNMQVPFSIDVTGVASFNGRTYPGFLPQGTTFLDFDGTFMGTVSSDYDSTKDSSLNFAIDSVFLSTLNLLNCSDSSQSDGPGCIWYYWVPNMTGNVINVLSSSVPAWLYVGVGQRFINITGAGIAPGTFVTSIFNRTPSPVTSLRLNQIPVNGVSTISARTVGLLSCGFHRSQLKIVSDGRCLGACALFVQILVRNGLAQLYTVGSNNPAEAPQSSIAPAAVVTSLSSQYCSSFYFNKTYDGSQRLVPSLAYKGLMISPQAIYMPVVGQDVFVPVGEMFIGDSNTPAAQQPLPASMMPDVPIAGTILATFGGQNNKFGLANLLIPNIDALLCGPLANAFPPSFMFSCEAAAQAASAMISNISATMQQLTQMKAAKGLTMGAVCGIGLFVGFLGMFLFNAHSKVPMAAFSRIRGSAGRRFGNAGSINGSNDGSSMMGYTTSSELPRAPAQEPQGYQPPAAADISVTRPSPVAQGGGRKGRSVTRRSDKEDMNASLLGDM